jgi:hypothetical protein
MWVNPKAANFNLAMLKGVVARSMIDYPDKYQPDSIIQFITTSLPSSVV